MVVASPIPGFKDAADDDSDAVETDLAADRDRVVEDQQVWRETESYIRIICAIESDGSSVNHIPGWAGFTEL